MQVKDSAFIVTGAASGLGAATVRMILEAGGKAVIADLDEAGGTALAKELGANARFLRTDVTDEASAEATVAGALAAFGTLRGLVNCAGVAPSEKVVGRDKPHGFASFSKVIAINLIGTFNMLRLAAQAMSTNQPLDSGERGVIVNTASIAAYDGQIAQAAYASSKAGVVGLTLPVARELARFGIRVMTVAPGIFATPMMMAFPQEVRDSIGRTIPFPQRLGEPSEFGALVRHIVENSMLNGEVIRLDGALRMAAK